MSRRKSKHSECDYIVRFYLQSAPVDVNTGQLLVQLKKLDLHGLWHRNSSVAYSSNHIKASKLQFLNVNKSHFYLQKGTDSCS